MPRQVHLLGTLSITDDGRPSDLLRNANGSALLAYLIVRGRAETREHLADLFWDAPDTAGSLRNLRVLLTRVRPHLPGLHTTRNSVQYIPQPDETIDYLTLSEHLTGGGSRPSLDDLRLYRGELLEGLALADAPRYMEWLTLQRERLRRAVLEAHRSLCQTLADEERWALGAEAAAHWLTIDETDEAALRWQLQFLAAQGQITAARQAYAAFQKILEDEWGLEPEAATQALAEELEDWSEGMENVDLPSLPPSHFADTQSVDAPCQLWGEAPDVPKLYGREGALAELERLLVPTPCRLIGLLGMGGVGKTTLAAATVAAVAPHFDQVIWRSLLNAPPLDELLHDILQERADGRLREIPSAIDAQLAMLLDNLRQQRYLLVLDNLESILQPDQPGQMIAGYGGYAQLLQYLAEYRHQSCLLFTSRERPQALARWEEDNPQVRTLRLDGLDEKAGQAMLRDRAVAGSITESDALIHRYSGNPLALKLVAHTIQELFGGDTAAFLATDAVFFDDIGAVLDQQFARLSSLEQTVLFWLAAERTPVAATELYANLVQPPPMSQLISALHALQRRSLLERVGDGFTLQNVVIEYLTKRLVDEISREIGMDWTAPAEADTAHPLVLSSLNRFALINTQAVAYIRESQIRLLLRPVARRVQAQLGKTQLAVRVQQLLAALRQTPQASGYAGGNLLNLLIELGIAVRDYDFSNLAVRQAYLRGGYLPGLQLAGADLTGIAFTHNFGVIHDIQFHSDGELVVMALKGELLGLWRARTGELVQSITINPHNFDAAVLRSDCRLIAQINVDHSISLIDVTTGRLLHTLVGHRSPVWRLRFSRDDQTMASGDSEGWVTIWDIAEGKLLTRWQAQADAVTALAFAPDSEQIATGGLDGTVCLWHVRSATLLRTYRGHTDEVAVLDFTPDGAQLITGSHDHTVRMWNTASGATTFVLQGHTQFVRHMAVDPNGRWLATGGLDRFFALWEIQSGKVHQILADDASSVKSIVFSSDGQTVATYNMNETISVWAAASGQRLHTYQLHNAGFTTVAFSPRGRRLVSGSMDWAIYLWDILPPMEPELTTRLAGHTYPISTVAFSPDGALIASGDNNGGLHLWNRSGGESRILPASEGHVGKVEFSPDGRYLVSAGDDGLRLWSVADGRLLQLLQGPTRGARSCAFSPDGRWLASSSLDHTLCQWEIDGSAGGVLRRTLHHHSNIVPALLYSPDGDYLISSSFDRTLCRWDAHTGTLQASWPTHDTFHLALAIHPDGRLLAAGGTDQIIRLLDIESGRVCRELHGHTSIVKALSYTADGKLLASVSYDETIRLWEVSSGRCLQTLRAPGPYEGMNISSVTGITEAQKAALRSLGAVAE